MNIWKQIKLFNFFKRELSVKKYFNYIRHKLIGYSMSFVLLNMEKTLAYIVLIISMTLLYNDKEIDFLRKNILDMIYGRGLYKECGVNNKLMNIYADIYNQNI